MLTSRRLPLPLLLFFCSITVAGQSSAQYTITELGNFSPRAVNNSATVVGSMGNKAVLFHNGVLTRANWLTQISVRLPDQLNGAGEVRIKISFRGQTSNPGSIIIAPGP